VSFEKPGRPWERVALGALSFLSLLVIACFLARTTPDGDLWGHL